MVLQTEQSTLKRKNPFKRILFIILFILLITTGVSAYLFRNLWLGDLDLPVTQTSYLATVESTEVEVATLPPATITNTWPIQLTHLQADSYTVVVNKKHKLQADYIPADMIEIYYGNMRAYAAKALKNLFNGAVAAGFNLKLVSSYRSYNTQAELYDYYASVDGVAAADTYSARPGHSEHQLGLAADVAALNYGCQLLTCFGNTEPGQWIAANAANYGFIIRYPEGKEDITGYQYEPWHLRYVGINIAKSVVASGLTLDEYFGKTGGGY